MQELDLLSKEISESLKSYQETMGLSEELDNVLSDSKKLENELDRFIFEKASWKSQENPVAESMIDSVIKELLDELEGISKKVSDFEDKRIKLVNDKVDEYQTSMNAIEKGVPEHVKSRQQAVNDIVKELRSIEDYAKEVIEQRKGTMKYVADCGKMENEAKQLQQVKLFATKNLYFFLIG